MLFRSLNVIGAIIPVVVLPGVQIGLLVLALGLGFAGLSYVGGLRAGHDRPGAPRRPTLLERIRATRGIWPR